MATALITGITGQDGSYLAELLLEKGYKVHGIVRRSSTPNTTNIDHILKDAHIKGISLYREYGDLTDASNISKIIERTKPDEIYNLGAQSHVRISFDTPEYTSNVVALGPLRILDAINTLRMKTRYFQASSSEMFGSSKPPQSENTPFHPRNPYACAKLFGYWITINYRESYGLHASNGITFNHESPRRGINFVTRKVTRGLSRIRLGLDDCIYLGNLEAKRDWGYSKEYVEAMWLMLQQDEPDDYVLATGEVHSVRELVEETARLLDFDLVWKGNGKDEVGIDNNTGKTIIRIDPYFYRPAETNILQGDSSKIKKKLGWEPKTRFKDIIKLMVESDMARERLEHN